MQKDLTEVKIFQKVYGGYFFETPCSTRRSWESSPGGGGSFGVISGSCLRSLSPVTDSMLGSCTVVGETRVARLWAPRVSPRH